MTKSVEIMDDVIRSATYSDLILGVLFNKAIEAIEAIEAVKMSDQCPDFQRLDRKAYTLCKSLYKVYMNRAIRTSLIDPRILTHIHVYDDENGGRKREMEKNVVHNTLTDMLNNKKKNMQNKLFLQWLFGTRLPWQGEDVDDNEQPVSILSNGELWSWSAYDNARLQSGSINVGDDEQQRDSLWLRFESRGDK